MKKSRQTAKRGRKAPGAATNGSKARSATRGKPLVLVVDDYGDAREMYAEYLEFEGFRVEQAENGQQALARAEKNPPDVVLMDLSLPVMDGWEATRRLKANDRLRHIPVIALTGHALSGTAETAAQAGCDAFVTKPCLPEDLVMEIRRAIQRHPSSKTRS
jgi:two-component system cell cycle response regulator DivK